MRQAATSFINDWIAIELLTEAPCGEPEWLVLQRFRHDAILAGLTVEEISSATHDPDMLSVLCKHGSSTNGK